MHDDKKVAFVIMSSCCCERIKIAKSFKARIPRGAIIVVVLLCNQGTHLEVVALDYYAYHSQKFKNNCHLATMNVPRFLEAAECVFRTRYAVCLVRERIE